MELSIEFDFPGATQSIAVTEPLKAHGAGLAVESLGLLVIEREV